MDWIKRNLLFVFGSAVALVLMGLAGYYLYVGMDKNSAALEKLNAEYTEMKRLNEQKPHPGNGATDNIKAAKEQEALVRKFIGKTGSVFQPASPIPSLAELNNATLAGALRRTIDQMRKDASSAGVQIPPNFQFSFAAVKDRIMFDPKGLVPLSTQLGEVKTICDILFAARINAIDNIRREKVSIHDAEFSQTTDYISKATVTNDVGIITPYEVSIRCFSSELAAILSGFASSPHGLLVLGINVEPAIAVGGAAPDAASAPAQGSPLRTSPGMIGANPTPSPSVAAPPATKGGLPILLDEKQLRVNMLIEVVKVTSKK